MDLVSNALEYVYSENSCSCRNILAFIGLVCATKCAAKTVLSLWRVFKAYFLAPWGVARINLRNHGEWAIVTGASEGIGKGYALELARQGFNIVIMSRSEDKLKKVEDEIRSKYSRDVRIVSVDFTKGQCVYEDIQAEISDLDVGILVNNVGLSLTMPNNFDEIPEERHRDIIEVNCQSMVQMTHLVLPKMAENCRGIIINIASLAGVYPTPMLTVYGATKTFVTSFSTALRWEYKSKGIIVQTVCPGFVATSMSQIKKAKWWAPDPMKYARQAVATIGVQDVTTACLAHSLQWYISSFIPSSIYYRFVLNTMEEAKKRQLKRQNKSK